MSSAEAGQFERVDAAARVKPDRVLDLDLVTLTLKASPRHSEASLSGRESLGCSVWIDPHIYMFGL